MSNCGERGGASDIECREIAALLFISSKTVSVHVTNIKGKLGVSNRVAMAGAGLRHGQVIGATDPRGGAIASSPVRPQDLAATVFQFLGINTNAHWTNPCGRPIPIVVEGGRPIPELT